MNYSLVLKSSNFEFEESYRDMADLGMTASLRYYSSNPYDAPRVHDILLERNRQGYHAESSHFNTICGYKYFITSTSGRTVLDKGLLVYAHPYALAEMVAKLKDSFEDLDDCKNLVAKLRGFKPKQYYGDEQLLEGLKREGLNPKASTFVEMVTAQGYVDPSTYTYELRQAIDPGNPAAARIEEGVLPLAEGCSMRRVFLDDRGNRSLTAYLYGLNAAANAR